MWAYGRYAKIFVSPKSLNVDNRLIVFDLENLSHHPRLQSVYFYVIRKSSTPSCAIKNSGK